ncbi:hypothetical protein [Polynucleobacter sp. AP-RePozz3-80-G7]|uniref:hypothetical protein n=1 Tax=Polynucleobacter sp. AP-RePozz3-80-G7 TaxID=2689105 RepID=UPI001C0E7042|nr:hypothetical protein [Polynucleobacter sp. AP-RePozz3-80-G7]MBU3638549.1 hypothetical protein [Polynucleobacter sp. AP-RePozz3-80-G7]
MSKNSSFLLFAILIVGCAALLYLFQFHEILDIGETEGFGYVGIIQSDAINYLNIYRQDNIFVYLDAGVANTFMPTIIWKFLNGNWYFSTVLNVFLLFLTGVYIKKIADNLSIEIKIIYILILFFLPETFIYLTGVLKEIPSLFLVTASTYYFIKRRWILYSVSCIFLILFRYQFLAGIGLFLFSHFIFKGGALRFLIYLSVALAASYPFWVNNIPSLGLDNAVLYRQMQNGFGLGEINDYLQFNYYGISMFATVVKFFQMIVEPWPNIDFVNEQNINIISSAYSITAIIMLVIWYKYFHVFFYSFKNYKKVSQNILTVVCMSFSFLMMPIFNSFVHHRYLFPMIGLVLLIASISNSKCLLKAPNKC